VGWRSRSTTDRTFQNFDPYVKASKFWSVREPRKVPRKSPSHAGFNSNAQNLHRPRTSRGLWPGPLGRISSLLVCFAPRDSSKKRRPEWFVEGERLLVPNSSRTMAFSQTPERMTFGLLLFSNPSRPQLKCDSVRGRRESQETPHFNQPEFRLGLKCDRSEANA
jgi:hypothetical protein